MICDCDGCSSRCSCPKNAKFHRDHVRRGGGHGNDIIVRHIIRHGVCVLRDCVQRPFIPNLQFRYGICNRDLRDRSLRRNGFSGLLPNVDLDALRNASSSKLERSAPVFQSGNALTVIGRDCLICNLRFDGICSPIRRSLCIELYFVALLQIDRVLSHNAGCWLCKLDVVIIVRKVLQCDCVIYDRNSIVVFQRSISQNISTVVSKLKFVLPVPRLPVRNGRFVHFHVVVQDRNRSVSVE